ncbi:A-kinase anchor protein 17A-like isoform X2 [Anneissia japonica]|nr:A-kinase anchor protein 17A-like isoform X2 [Anneissia japonica]XP_033127112.1 A-kinase anchor protein 17A-like isoform X2 [Anneissia japonica]
MASTTQLCSDTSEAIELFEPQKLYLKPIAKLSISVTLPQLKSPGKSISNWEVMEKLKNMVHPDQFIILRVKQSSLDFIRFEAEVETKALLKVLILRLDGKSIKLSGFSEMLKVRAAEAKVPHPTRHDWDSFFRDAKDMNECNPGERPDTIHLENLPGKWFSTKKDPDKPSEFIVRKIFEQYGELRNVDIPILDSYRHENQITGGKFGNFSFGGSITFNAYIQFTEYIGFVKAMDSLKGMKLMRKDEGKAHTVDFKVDFDKTKHMSAKAIRRRIKERERLIQLEKEREELKKREREAEEHRLEDERRKKEEVEREKQRRKIEKTMRRMSRQEKREERRRVRREERKRIQAEFELQRKIAMEERKLLLAQRQLQSIRLLTELFNRLKKVRQQEEVQRKVAEIQSERIKQIEKERKKKQEEERKKKKQEERKARELRRRESKLKKKLLKNMEDRNEKRKIEEMEELRKKVVAGKARLKSAVISTHKKKQTEMKAVRSKVVSSTVPHKR